MGNSRSKSAIIATLQEEFEGVSYSGVNQGAEVKND